MTWEIFFEAIMYLSHFSDTLRTLSAADLVIGRVDMAMSYL
jgi:hypothetical protein